MALNTGKRSPLLCILIQIIDGRFIFSNLLANDPPDTKLANVPLPSNLGGLHHTLLANRIANTSLAPAGKAFIVDNPAYVTII